MIDLRLGDCLEVMPSLPGASIDLILADLPYGTTACKWDAIIPFEPLWNAYRRLLKPRGAVVLTASQPFTSALVMSNLKDFRYRWVWDKVNRITGFLDAKTRPLRVAEDVCVFYAKQPTFNPQMVAGKPYQVRRRGTNPAKVYHADLALTDGCYDGERYPQDILRIVADRRGTEGRVHPTQKPIALMEYLIRTYTDPGATVLDNTMGSGTTGVACLRTDRRFIGIEKDPHYFLVAESRINTEIEQYSLLGPATA
jgi:DNA modification methylase